MGKYIITPCPECGLNEDEANERVRESFCDPRCGCPDHYSQCPVHGPKGEYEGCTACLDDGWIWGTEPDWTYEYRNPNVHGPDEWVVEPNPVPQIKAFLDTYGPFSFDGLYAESWRIKEKREHYEVAV